MPATIRHQPREPAEARRWAARPARAAALLRRRSAAGPRPRVLPLGEQRRHFLARSARAVPAGARADRQPRAAAAPARAACCVDRPLGRRAHARGRPSSAFPRAAHAATPGDSSSASSSSVAVAASAGSFASANANARLRQQRDAGAERQDAEAEPDPVDQRVDVHLDARRLFLELVAGQHDVEVLGERAADRDFGRRLVLVLAEEPLRRDTSCRSRCPPRLSTVMWPVTICFWPSSVTRSASWRSV